MVQTVTAPANDTPAAPQLEAMPRTVRHAYSLQQSPAAIPAALTPEVVATVARYLPAALTTSADNPPDYQADRREWLTAAPTLRPRSGGAGRPWSIAFGEPPRGLSGVECVLWQELGAACARAVLWTAEYVRTRRFMTACELAEATADVVSSWRMASPLYALIYSAAEAAVRSGRLARCEDTLHDLANGAIKRQKQTLTKDGEVVTLTEDVPPDTKALALALGAEDPARYRQQAAVAGGAAIAINIQYSGVGWGGRPVEVDVSGPAYDADSVPAEVSDTEEELG